MEAGKFLTTRQAAEMLQVSIRTMQGWRLHGDGPVFVRIGASLIRYRLSDIQAYVDGRKSNNTTEEQVTAHPNSRARRSIRQEQHKAERGI